LHAIVAASLCVASVLEVSLQTNNNSSVSQNASEQPQAAQRTHLDVVVPKELERSEHALEVALAHRAVTTRNNSPVASQRRC
jgi:hypothetical protein